MRGVRAVMGLVALLAVLAVGACGSAPEPTVPPDTATSVPSEPPASTQAPAPSGQPTTQPTSRPPGPDAVPPGLLGQDIERIPTSSRIVALTFDAGANGNAVPSILATLAREHVPGTFFLTGTFVRQFPDATRSITAAGHRLANHSATHPEFTSLTSDQIRDEVRSAERAIRDATGADPRPFFRFPFGDRDTRTIQVVNDLGYVPVRWTVDTLGWQGTSGGRSAAEVVQRVVDRATAGEIVLMHVGSHPTDGSTLDADALPEIIARLRSAGYQFVSLDALLD